MTFRPPLIALLAATGALGMCAHPEPALPPEVTHQVDFVTEVKPILTQHCLPCHHGGTLLNDFNLETKEKAFRLGRNGPLIVPHSPETSRVWYLLATPHPSKPGEDLMPSHGDRLTDTEKNILYQWIEQGAAWPDGEAGRLHPISEPNEA